MKIAICSDIHDNVWALDGALAHVQEADLLLFCGDFCAPFTLVQLAQGFSRPIYVVWGNNDGDKWLLTQQAARFDHVTLFGELADFEVGGAHVAMTHYPEIANGLARAGTYDLVCYGHDHIACDEQVGVSRLVNPGEVMGRLGKSTLAILDLQTGTLEQIQVEYSR